MDIMSKKDKLPIAMMFTESICIFIYTDTVINEKTMVIIIILHWHKLMYRLNTKPCF